MEPVNRAVYSTCAAIIKVEIYTFRNTRFVTTLSNVLVNPTFSWEIQLFCILILTLILILLLPSPSHDSIFTHDLEKQPWRGGSGGGQGRARPAAPLAGIGQGMYTHIALPSFILSFAQSRILTFSPPPFIHSPTHLLTNTPTNKPTLLNYQRKAWRAGQKMRSYFHLADLIKSNAAGGPPAAASANTSPPGRVVLMPAVYAGAEGSVPIHSQSQTLTHHLPHINPP